jgi:Tol biopolymer transport system component
LAANTTSTVYETTQDKGVFAPRWSPDGAALVFEQAAADDGEFLGVSLEVLNVTALSQPQTIVPVEMMANNSDWSPDGILIAFSAPIEGGEPGGALSDIWVVKPDGTGLRRVTDVAASGGSAVQPTFVPDRSRIMFGAHR